MTGNTNGVCSQETPPHICVHKHTCRQMRADVSERGANSVLSERGPWSQLLGLWPQRAKFSVGIFRHGRSCQNPDVWSPLCPGQTASKPMLSGEFICSDVLSRITVDLPVAAAAPCQCRAASPLFMSLYHARARCHGNRCLFASWALSRGGVVNRCGPEEVKASANSAPLEPWRGFDGDGDKRPIPSSAPPGIV